MQSRLLALLFVLGFVFSGTAAAQNNDEYKAEDKKQR